MKLDANDLSLYIFNNRLSDLLDLTFGDVFNPPPPKKIEEPNLISSYPDIQLHSER